MCDEYSNIIPADEFMLNFTVLRPIDQLSLCISNVECSRIDECYWVSEYSGDIFKTMRSAELERHMIYFRTEQSDSRSGLLNLMKAATEVNSLTRTTLHLAVYFLDRFMDTYTISSGQLRLIAITCLMIASKLEEADINIPKFASLNRLVDNAYTLTDLKAAEMKILNTFQFNLFRPTAATFAEFFADNLVTVSDYNTYLRHWHNGTLNSQQEGLLDQQILKPLYTSYEEMSMTLRKSYLILIDVSLNYIRFANTRPSIIAAASIATVRRFHSILPYWSTHLMQITECTNDVIEPYVAALIRLHKIGNEFPARAARVARMFDSPDSGIVLENTRFDTSDDDSDYDNHEHDDYNCLEYPLPAKRRKIS